MDRPACSGQRWGVDGQSALMFATLKAAWQRFMGGAPAGSAAPAIPAVEYKGYRIRPAPYRSNDHYQTAGSIEKDTADGIKEHRFVRADTHASMADAVAFTVAKAKQIIDQQGDRIFSP